MKSVVNVRMNTVDYLDTEKQDWTFIPSSRVERHKKNNINLLKS